MNAILELRSKSENETISNSQENLEALDILFSRYRRALSLVAYRVLGNHEEAEEAVQNCLRTVADNVPRFEHEGAFRCWLESLSMKLCYFLASKVGHHRILKCLSPLG